MMTLIDDYKRRLQRQLRSWTEDRRIRTAMEWLLWALTGFFLSAASIGSIALPLAPAVLYAGLTGIPAVMAALGGCAGYLLFWQEAGLQGVAWMLTAMAVALTLGSRQIAQRVPMLLCAVATMMTALWGVMFQLLGTDSPPIPLYLLRVASALGVSWLFAQFRQYKDALTQWLVAGIGVLALAQVAPVTFLNFGCIAAGYLSSAGAFPAAALGGLALDLAGITPTPMAAVICLGWLLRMIPRIHPVLRAMGAGLLYIPVMYYFGAWDISPMAGLFVGGAVSLFVPGIMSAPVRRGETGAAQVRLELAAQVFAQSGQLLLEVQEPPVDTQALVEKAAVRACSVCPCHKDCRDQKAVQKLDPRLLELPLEETAQIGNPCRRSGRLLQELRRGKDQLRAILQQRSSRRDHRRALIQQYCFLAEYLQNLSDDLGKKMDPAEPRFEPEIQACTQGAQSANGDRCSWFSGPRCRYFVMLCDGMGTGMGAREESREAGEMLKRLLRAGYPPEHALASLNSLCALRSRAGAVTVDLLELQLDTGRALLYKWGAAPSYLLQGAIAQKIGTAGPPPGLSVTETRETVLRLSLRRGETLIMLSDGAGGEEIPNRAALLAGLTPGEMASAVLKDSALQDDATAAVIRLRPAAVSTS